MTFYLSPSGFDVYLLFSAYQTASSFASGTLGDCTTIRGLSVPLKSPFFVTSPPAVDSDVIQYNATTSLINSLGFPSCTPIFAIGTSLIQIQYATPVDTGASVSSTSSSSPSLSLLSTSRNNTRTYPTRTAQKSLSPKRKLQLVLSVQSCLLR